MFLGFVMSRRQGIRMEPSKTKVLKEWSVPTSITEVRSFMGLASFYRKYIRNRFLSITDCLKNKTFHGLTKLNWGFSF